MRTETYRQGDVLVRRTSKRPSATAKTVTDRGRVILALGEQTGHAHEVIGVDNADPVPAMQLFEEPDGTRLLVIARPAALVHEEHGRIALEPGTFEVIRQKEYVAPEISRSVAD